MHVLLKEQPGGHFRQIIEGLARQIFAANTSGNSCHVNGQEVFSGEDLAAAIDPHQDDLLCGRKPALKVVLTVWHSSLVWSAQNEQVVIEGKRASIATCWGSLARRCELVEVSGTSTPHLGWHETMADYVHRLMLAHATVADRHGLAKILMDVQPYVRSNQPEWFETAYSAVKAEFQPGHSPAAAIAAAQRICREAVAAWQ